MQLNCLRNYFSLQSRKPAHAQTKTLLIQHSDRFLTKIDTLKTARPRVSTVKLFQNALPQLEDDNTVTVSYRLCKHLPQTSNGSYLTNSGADRTFHKDWCSSDSIEILEPSEDTINNSKLIGDDSFRKDLSQKEKLRIKNKKVQDTTTPGRTVIQSSSIPTLYQQIY